MLDAESNFARLRHDFEITANRIVLRIRVVKYILYLFILKSVLSTLFLIIP